MLKCLSNLKFHYPGFAPSRRIERVAIAGEAGKFAKHVLLVHARSANLAFEFVLWGSAFTSTEVVRFFLIDRLDGDNWTCRGGHPGFHSNM